MKRFRHRRFQAEELEPRQMLEASAELVADVNLASPGACANDDVAWLGNDLYFAADEGTGDVELWKSDGTTAGTNRVKDIQAGKRSSFPRWLTAAESRLYFSAHDDETGFGLWFTDGTEAGTQFVTELNPGYEGSFSESLGAVAVGDRLFYSNFDGTNGYELWVTDGTQPGTRLVVDINPGADSSSPREFTRLGNQVLFTATDTDRGREVWISDGTEAGTRLVAEIEPGTINFPGGLVRFRDRVIFFSSLGNPGSRSLWSTDGTEAGTQKLISNIQYGRTAITDDHVYFAFSKPNDFSRSTIVRTSGSLDSTQTIQFDRRILAIAATSEQVYFLVDELEKIDGQNFQTIDSGQLWTIDGDGLVPTQVEMIPQVRQENWGGCIASTASSLYFVATDNDERNQLWRIDASGTAGVILEDDDATPIADLFTVTHNGQLTLFWTNSDTQHILWSVDESTASTSLVTDSLLRPSQGSLSDSNYFRGRLFGLGEHVVFETVDREHHHHLWASDGTAFGTVPLSVPPITGELIVVDDRLYFGAEYDEINDSCLWSSDGTDVGTVPVMNANGDCVYPPEHLVESVGSLFYVAHGAGTQGLWAIVSPDSTPILLTDPDTEVIVGAKGFFDGRDKGRVTTANGFVYFLAYRDTAIELWKANALGTTRVAALPIENLEVEDLPTILPAKDRVFLLLDDELWITEEASGETRVVTDIPNGARLLSAGVLQNTVLLALEGEGLIATDGTTHSVVATDGQVGPHSIAAGSFFDGDYFTRVGEHAYFSVRVGENFEGELWRTDGTSEGTMRVAEFARSPAIFAATGTDLYFSASDERGEELWRTDGTPTDTERLTDINPGAGYSNPTGMTQSGDWIYFGATDGFHGVELFRIAKPSPERIPGDANNDGRVDAVDLSVVGMNWQKDVFGGANGDFNGDGHVDPQDLNLLALNWLTGVAPEEAAADLQVGRGLRKRMAVPREPRAASQLMVDRDSVAEWSTVRGDSVLALDGETLDDEGFESGRWPRLLRGSAERRVR